MAHNTNRKAASSEKERSGWIKVWLISAVAQESDLLPGNVSSLCRFTRKDCTICILVPCRTVISTTPVKIGMQKFAKLHFKG